MRVYLLILIAFLIFVSCDNSQAPGPAAAPNYSPSGAPAEPTSEGCAEGFYYEEQKACNGKVYPDPATSPYILPFFEGRTFRTGLSNCSSSFHSPGTPDALAFDFDMPVGEKFIAARDGIVVGVENSKPSGGGGSGNWVAVEHRDGTVAYYLHSPEGGISVAVGQVVQQGQVLGVTGMSGLAGYPHLHFIVVEGPGTWPYEGVPVSFNNVVPNDVVLESYKEYGACEN